MFLDQPGGAHDIGAALLDLHPRSGYRVRENLPLGELRPGDHPLITPPAHLGEAALRGTDRPHRERDPADADPALHHGETFSLASEQVPGGNADVLEAQAGVPVRRVVIAKYRVVALDREPRGMARHQDDRMTCVARRVRGRSRQHERDLAVLLHAAGGPGLASVQHVFPTLASRLELQLGGIRARHVRLGDADRGANAALEQPGQVLGADLGGGELLDELRVPDRPGVAVECLRADRRSAHHFCERRVVEKRQAVPAQFTVEREDP